MKLFCKLICFICILWFGACQKDEDQPSYFVHAFDDEQCAVTLTGSGVQDRNLTKGDIGTQYAMQVAYKPMYDGTVYTVLRYSVEFPFRIDSEQADSTKLIDGDRIIYLSQPVVKDQIYTKALRLQITGTIPDRKLIGPYHIAVTSVIASSQWANERRQVIKKLDDYLQIYTSAAKYFCSHCYQILPTSE